MDFSTHTSHITHPVYSVYTFFTTTHFYPSTLTDDLPHHLIRLFHVHIHVQRLFSWFSIFPHVSPSILLTSPLVGGRIGWSRWARCVCDRTSIVYRRQRALSRRTRIYRGQPTYAAEPHPKVQTARRIARRRSEPSSRETTPSDFRHHSHQTSSHSLERQVGCFHL